MARERAAVGVKCSVCGKGGCKPWELNTDGTYTHAACLYAASVAPAGKGSKGGNLYGSKGE